MTRTPAPVPSPTRSLRRTFVHDHVVLAPPDAIFPLLCPVREYEWIPTWECRLVHAESGVAEHGCIFTTGFGNGEETWVCTTYRPPTAIEYTRFADEGWVAMLGLSLAPAPGGTLLSVRQMFTAVTPQGQAAVAAMSEDTERGVWDDLSRLAGVWWETTGRTAS